MSFQPLFTITPKLLSQAEQIAALRERFQGEATELHDGFEDFHDRHVADNRSADRIDQITMPMSSVQDDIVSALMGCLANDR